MREIKFRAWDKKTKEMIPVFSINFEKKLINMEGAWRMFKEIDLMQYTGEKDRKGEEIYEGDVLRIFDGVKYQGVWQYEGREVIEEIRQTWKYIQCEECEVIGNIYENPELLGVK